MCVNNIWGGRGFFLLKQTKTESGKLVKNFLSLPQFLEKCPNVKDNTLLLNCHQDLGNKWNVLNSFSNHCTNIGQLQICLVL